MKSKSGPTVSVITISYNQEAYIAEALQSIVAQKTKFQYEIIVADDASSDGTQKIIRDFGEKYPDKIKPILRQKNIGAWENFVDAIQQARGQYIAICEGDDYWTEDTKLQQQVDFLDTHKDYAICFHPVKVFFQNKQKSDSVFPVETDGFTVDKLLENNFIQTNSVMYRAQNNYKNLAAGILPGDWYLHLYHAQFGKIGFINQIMSAYRRHEDGIWWHAQNDIEKLWLKNGIRQLRMLGEVLKMYHANDKQAATIRGSIAFLLDRFIELDARYKTGLFEQAMSLLPELVINYAQDQLANIQNLFDERERLKLSLEKAEYEIHTMKSSRIWKTGLKLRKLRPHPRKGRPLP